MSDAFTIGMVYEDPLSPKKIFQFLLENGWEYANENGQVMFVPAKEDEDDDYDWEDAKLDAFSVETFIESHGPDDSVRIRMRKGDFSGLFCILKEVLYIIIDSDVVELDVETQYSRRVVPDFSWYIEQIMFLLDYTGSRSYDFSVI